VHLYEQVVAERSENPHRFDRLHPILGELLTDRASFEYWLNRWQAHPARFEHYHPWFWRVIDGESRSGGPPVTLPPVPPMISPAGESGNPPIGPGPLPPEPPPPPRPPAAPVPVPEPGSLLVLLEAIGLVLLARRASVLVRSC
jgi:hypothetical protein